MSFCELCAVHLSHPLRGHGVPRSAGTLLLTVMTALTPSCGQAKSRQASLCAR